MDVQKEIDVLTLELSSQEVEVLVALLADRQSRNKKLISKSASRVTRYAATHEMEIIDGVFKKMGAAAD